MLPGDFRSSRTGKRERFGSSCGERGGRISQQKIDMKRKGRRSNREVRFVGPKREEKASSSE